MSRLSKSAGLPRPGTVVEFLHGNKCQAAWVLEENAGKLRLFTATGREIKLPGGRLLPWSGPAYDASASRSEMEQRLREHQDRREHIAAEADVLEIWELAQEEVDKAPIEFFAELLWESPDADQLAGLGRAMLEAKARFKYQPPQFEIHSREVVERKEREMEVRRRREQAARAGREVFKALWSASCSRTAPDISFTSPEAAEALQDVLLALLRDPEDAEASAIFAEARKGLPDHPQLALVLARAWGVVEPHFDPIPAQIGYDLDDAWSARFEEDIRVVREAFERRRAEEAAAVQPSGLVSVDSAATTDRDDAVEVRRLPDGGFRARVALARPTLGWTFGSDLDAEVASRVTSLYLPEAVSHMLPEALGVELFSLQEGEARPVLLLDMTVTPDGELAEITPSLDWTVVAENMTYEQAEEAVRTEPESMLAQAHELAQALRQARIRRGAVIIERPDPEIRLEPGDDGLAVHVDLKPETPAAWLAVSELMLLSNLAAARWACEREVPLIHRTQDITLPDSLAGVWSRPEDIYQAVRMLAPPVAEVAPKPHASIGVDAYSPVSSPLRRYADFLNLAQIESFLEQGRPRLDKDQLAAMLPRLNARTQEVSQVQRFRPRYWKLLHLRQNLDAFHRAVLVDDSQPVCTFAMPHLQIYVRAPKDMVGEKTAPGQEVLLRFNRVDPLTNEMRVCEVAEPMD
jgi:exoribonuclease-2